MYDSALTVASGIVVGGGGLLELVRLVHAARKWRSRAQPFSFLLSVVGG